MCEGAFNNDLNMKIYYDHSNHESNYTSYILCVINFVSKFLYKTLIIFKLAQTIHIAEYWICMHVFNEHF